MPFAEWRWSRHLGEVVEQLVDGRVIQRLRAVGVPLPTAAARRR